MVHDLLEFEDKLYSDLLNSLTITLPKRFQLNTHWNVDLKNGNQLGWGLMARGNEYINI